MTNDQMLIDIDSRYIERDANNLRESDIVSMCVYKCIL